MTSRKVTTKPRRSKKTAENPAIRRAARRAGIAEQPSKPREYRTREDYEAAADEVVGIVLGDLIDKAPLPYFREVMLERLAERFAKEAEGTVNPDELERRHDRREERLASLSRLLSGGLWVDDEHGDRAEVALLHVAAAQIKAVMLAMTTSDGIGADGWCLDHDEMTEADIHAALSGVVATLQAAPKLLAELRSKDEWRNSTERSGRTDAREFKATEDKAQAEQEAS